MDRRVEQILLSRAALRSDGAAAGRAGWGGSVRPRPPRGGAEAAEAKRVEFEPKPAPPAAPSAAAAAVPFALAPFGALFAPAALAAATPPDPRALGPWTDLPERAPGPPAAAAPEADAMLASLRATTAAVAGGAYAAQLVAAMEDTDSRRERWRFLDVLDRVDDPATRAAMMAAFARTTGQPLREFVEGADWDGEHDRTEARALIAPERDRAEAELAAMAPEARARLTGQAHGWAQQVLDVTRDSDADDDPMAHQLIAVLGPRTPVEIEAIRAAVRTTTHGDQTLYQELEQALGGDHEDEAVAALGGDPVHTASVGLRLAEDDPDRMKAILRGLAPAQIAELRARNSFAGLTWIAGAVEEGEDRDEIAALVAGDPAAADAVRFTSLLRGPDDAMVQGAFRGDERSQRALDARTPENVIRALEHAPPAAVVAARAAWDREAATTGSPTWDDLLAERFADGDATTYLRLAALTRGDRAEDRALALRAGMRDHDQAAIEAALASPDLASDDPARRAAARAEQEAVAARARAHDQACRQLWAPFFDDAAPEGRDLDAQLAGHYQAEATAPPALANLLPGAVYGLVEDLLVEARTRAAHDDGIASQELLADGVLSPETRVHRAQVDDDTTAAAAVIDGLPTTADVAEVAAQFEAKYGVPMIEAPDTARFEVQARLAQVMGDARPLSEIQRALAHADLNAAELRIDNVRVHGARPERREDLELGLQRELYATQHSGFLDATETLRAAFGGNLGTEARVREGLAVMDDALEPAADPLGLGPRARRPEVSAEAFAQADGDAVHALERQRAEKSKLGARIGKIFATIGKIAALLVGQPELFVLIDVAAGLGEMAIKAAIAGEAYDPVDDAKLLALTAVVDAAAIGAGALLAGKGAGAAAASTGEAAAIGERTAVEVVERGATAEATQAIVGEGAAAAAGEVKAVEAGVAAAAAGEVKVAEDVATVAAGEVEAASLAVAEGAPVLSEGAAVGEAAVASEAAPVMSEAVVADLRPTRALPHTPLSSAERRALQAKVDGRSITRAEWERLQFDRRFRNRRLRGVDRYWAEERRRLRAGEPGTRNWTPTQRDDILERRTPRFGDEPIEGHHLHNAADYPDIADDAANIYPATKNEHLRRWHGGNFQNDTAGQPLNPDFPEDF